MFNYADTDVELIGRNIKPYKPWRKILRGATRNLSFSRKLSTINQECGGGGGGGGLGRNVCYGTEVKG